MSASAPAATPSQDVENQTGRNPSDSGSGSSRTRARNRRRRQQRQQAPVESTVTLRDLVRALEEDRRAAERRERQMDELVANLHRLTLLVEDRLSSSPRLSSSAPRLPPLLEYEPSPGLSTIRDHAQRTPAGHASSQPPPSSVRNPSGYLPTPPYRPPIIYLYDSSSDDDSPFAAREPPADPPTPQDHDLIECPIDQDDVGLDIEDTEDTGGPEGPCGEESGSEEGEGREVEDREDVDNREDVKEGEYEEEADYEDAESVAYSEAESEGYREGYGSGEEY